MKKNSKLNSIFAIAIVIGLCTLPALYAWINIYANKNPYANTGNIKVAVSSYDKGIDYEGKHINASNDVIETLKDNKSMDFKILKNPDDAINGTKSGKYYAAIIFESNFTDNMYNMEKSFNKSDNSITYYSNTKKNAIASKITDSAADTVVSSVNNKYLETVLNTIFKKMNDISSDLKNTDVLDSGIEKLTKLKDDLSGYDSTVKLFLESSKNLEGFVSKTQSGFNKSRANGKSRISNVEQNIEEAKKAISNIEGKIDESINNLRQEIESLENSVNEFKNTSDDELKAKIKKDIERKKDKVATILEKLIKIVPENSNSNVINTLRNTINQMINNIKNIKDINQDVDLFLSDIVTLRELHETSLKPNFTNMISEFNNAFNLAKPIISSGKNMLDDINPILDASLKAASGIDGSMIRLERLLSSSVSKLDDLLTKLNNAKDEDKSEIIANFIGGNPEEYSKFFSSLVKVKTKPIYKEVNYGTAMTPFYSVLAIWVGGVMLVSVLSLDTNKKKYENKSDAYIFFRKFLRFFILGQIQAAIIIAGDILLLGATPSHPLLMFISASVTSFVFDIFIYSFALSFGDLGKGVVVVTMILQIAGSSGSYPIEILPEIFSKIYRFFPFPYAINAMREAIFGVYKFDYLIYLGQLMVFFIIAIVIGLVIKRPFMNVNNFVKEKLEETEVL